MKKKVIIVVIVLIIIVAIAITVVIKHTKSNNQQDDAFAFMFVLNDEEQSLYIKEKEALTSSIELIGDENTWYTNCHCHITIYGQNSGLSSEFEANPKEVYSFNCNNLEENDKFVVKLEIWASNLDKTFDKKPDQTFYWSFIPLHGETPITDTDISTAVSTNQIFLNGILIKAFPTQEEAEKNPLTIAAENISFSANAKEGIARLHLVICAEKSRKDAEFFLYDSNNWSGVIDDITGFKGEKIIVMISWETGDFIPDTEFEYIVFQIQ